MKVDQLLNYKNFKIFFTFLLLWFSVQFGVLIEDTVAFILIITIGIIHGANDLLIISKKHETSSLLTKEVFIYLGIIASCVILYFIHGFISMIVFIAISSYHFGEEHFSDDIRINFYFDTIYYSSYGLLIFSLIFINAVEGVSEVMHQLVGATFTTNQIETVLYTSLIIFFVLSIYVMIKKKQSYLDFGREIFYLMLLFLVFKTTSLVLGFAIYFIFWHSLPSIIHQVLFISGDFSKKSVTNYVKKAMLNWIISIIGLFLTYWFFPNLETFASVVFILLFAVTAPHMWVMHKMKN